VATIYHIGVSYVVVVNCYNTEMITFFLFVLGTVVGSFLNVVALRWGTGRTLLGRSSCPFCGKKLKWWELVPIVSFLVLRARCQGCQAKISWRYPLIELWTGLVFATVPYIFIPIFCIYIVITIYDLRHKIIPDSLVYASIMLALVLRLISGGGLWDWFSGPMLFTFFGSIWLLSRGRAMGLGDAKLGLSVGLLLGASQGFSAIVLAFWIGALASIVYLFFNKNLTMKSEVPFAPFIVAGAWVSLVFDLNIFYVTLF